jgi:hypothetical protein
MPYALQRQRDGKYVAPLGSEHSYVKSIENARAFDTLDDAELEQCSNEHIVQFGYIGAARQELTNLANEIDEIGEALQNTNKLRGDQLITIGSRIAALRGKESAL